jgi:hypothetical protein
VSGEAEFQAVMKAEDLAEPPENGGVPNANRTREDVAEFYSVRTVAVKPDMTVATWTATMASEDQPEAIRVIGWPTSDHALERVFLDLLAKHYGGTWSIDRSKAGPLVEASAAQTGGAGVPGVNVDGLDAINLEQHDDIDSGSDQFAALDLIELVPQAA